MEEMLNLSKTHIIVTNYFIGRLFFDVQNHYDFNYVKENVRKVLLMLSSRVSVKSFVALFTIPMQTSISVTSQSAI